MSDSIPPPSNNDNSPPQAAQPRRLPIKTYHCRFCSHLLIASTRDLLSASIPLKRRATATAGSGGGGLDAAIVLRVPGKTKTLKTQSHWGEESMISGSEMSGFSTVGGGGSEGKGAAGAGAGADATVITGHEQAHYTIPLSTLVPDMRPIIVRREDGFEKRLLLKCGRCRVVVGYEIVVGSGTVGALDEENRGEDDDDDDGENDEYEGEDDEEEEADEEANEETDGYRGRKKRRNNDKDRTLYLLPGSIVATEDLVEDGDGQADVVNGMIERNRVLKDMQGEWMQWLEQ